MISDFAPHEEEQLRRFSNQVNRCLVGILSLFFLFHSVYGVPQDEQAIVFRLGVFSTVETRAGLHLKWPFLDQVERVPSGFTQTLSIKIPPFRSGYPLDLDAGFEQPSTLAVTLRLQVSNATHYWLKADDPMTLVERQLTTFLSSYFKTKGHPVESSQDLTLLQEVLQTFLDTSDFGLTIQSIQIQS